MKKLLKRIDVWFFLIRLCEGGELLDRILARYIYHLIALLDSLYIIYSYAFSCLRGGKYPEEDAKAIVVQILNVVSFCHLQGVVHRDLKPEVLSSLYTPPLPIIKITKLSCYLCSNRIFYSHLAAKTQT